jgi:hypothetical protein
VERDKLIVHCRTLQATNNFLEMRRLLEEYFLEDPERETSKNAEFCFLNAFCIDGLAVNRELAEGYYRLATLVEPKNPEYMAYLVCFLITLGRIKEAKLEWEKYMSLSDKKRSVFMILHTKVMTLLLHRAQLDWAREIFETVPEEIKKEKTFLSLKNMLYALLAAQREMCVFPINIHCDDWWKGPHLAPKMKYDREYYSWYAGQICRIEGNTAYLIAGTNGDLLDFMKFEVCSYQIARPYFNDHAVDFKFEDLIEGMFMEIVFYGTNESLCSIHVHSDVPFVDPDLPKMDLDPVRYLRANSDRSLN